MSPVANRLRAYLPPQAVQPSGSIASQKHFIGFMAGKSHNNHLINARFPHISIKRMPHVM
jgi:hypothetical protein